MYKVNKKKSDQYVTETCAEQGNIVIHTIA